MDLDIDNAFAELGLSPGATASEVKAAWRRMVSQWHPDRNTSATAVAKMQRLNRAVEAIRQAGLDIAGPVAGDAAAPQAAQRSADGASAAAAGADRAADAERTTGTDEKAPARTIRRRVRLSLEEAAFGCTRVLRGRLTAACSRCEGAGFQVQGGHCPKCHGSGALNQRAWFSWLGTQTECDACHGGGIARQPCAACAASGKAASQRYAVTVRFPHGVRQGDQLTVARRSASAASPPGDLHIQVELLAHAFLTLDADGTLRCELPVSGFAWMANRSVDLPTLDGLHRLALQREQLSYRLKGLGFPVERRGQRGDLLVSVTPIFPQRLSNDQQILLDQLIATSCEPDAQAPDARLQRWQQTLRAWRDGRPGRP